MGFEDFKITFDNTQRAYFTGQAVTGKVTVTTTAQEKCHGIKLKFSGQAKVSWTESVGSSGQYIAYQVSDEETYFTEEVYVVGNGKDKVVIDAGQWDYPFQFRIPKDLASTFVGEHGSICYSIQATMKRSFKFDRSVMEEITVNGIVDLNTDETSVKVGEFVASKTIGCFCCSSGSVGFALSIPKRGFVPGEWIPVEAETRNNSSRDILSTKLALVQESVFCARGRTKVHNTVITFTNLEGVQAHRSDTVSGKYFQIPPIPPTIKTSSRIVTVNYKLEAIVHIKGPTFNLKGSVPLIIGTVPLRSDFAKYLMGREANSRRSSMAEDAFRPSAPPLHVFDSDLPPPTFAPASTKSYCQGSSGVNALRPVSAKVTPAETTGESSAEFVPRYVTWTSIYDNRN